MTPANNPIPSGSLRSEKGSGPVAFDPAAPAFISNPYPTYARLRCEDPIHQSPQGYWVMTRHDDILEALRDPRLGNAPSRYAVLHRRNTERYVSANIANDIIPFLDPPEHGPARRWVSKAFRTHLKQTPPDILGIANRLLAPLRDRGEIDLLADFAKPLSVSVISRILGVPREDEPRLEAWSKLFFYLFVPIPSQEVLAQMEIALLEFREYFLRLVAERRQSPRDDLISRFLAVQVDGGPPGDLVIADTCMLLFADGVENIDSTIANGVVALLEHPDQLRLLVREPARIHQAVEECLRYDPPVHFVGRIACEDIEIRGKTLRKDQAVLLMLASANRDPEHFDRSEEFDITRTSAKAGSPQLSFGRGRHLCIGAPLVRAEVATGLSSILEGLPNLARLDRPLRWIPRMGHRWLEALPVSFDVEAETAESSRSR